MEAVIAIVVLFVIVLVATKLVRRGDRDPKNAPDTTQSHRRPPIERTSTASTNHVRSRPQKHVKQRDGVDRAATAPPAFDEQSASNTPTGTTLRGAAFVVDGDTIVIDKTQIRLFGVDAPELNHPFGQKAKWALVKLCKGKTICAEILAEDAHGRTVAKCTLPDDRDLSAEMVEIGMAIDWPKYSGGIYRALETPDARKKLWLADARQKGRMHIWRQFEARKSAK